MHPKRVFAGVVGFVVLAAACTAARATIIYVDDDAPPGGNGSSWPTAFMHLQDALTAAQPSDEIRVAQGTYYPDRDAAHPTGTGDRAASFTLLDDVAIVGGYAGLGAPEPDERNIAECITTLSGDIGTPVSNGDNSCHVVHGGSSGVTALLDGFTITAGNASMSTIYGGGVYCASGSPTLTNCTITANMAGRGGGVYFSSSNGALTDCTVTGNQADHGGGVYCGASSPTLTNCTIAGNTTTGYGGGVDCYDHSSPTLANCTIADNTVSGYGGGGGGLYCYNYSSPTLTSCAITGNTTSESGGGVYCYDFSSPALTSCAITGNSASHGGGVCCYGSSCSPSLANCMIAGNTASYGGGAYYRSSPSSPMLTNCAITGNNAVYGGGLYCYGSSSNPTLTNCTITDNIARNSGRGGGVCCASYSSPTLMSCLVARNVAPGWGGGVDCSSSNTTLTNCTITLNSGSGVYCFADSSPTLTNCILWANAPHAIFVQSGSPVVTYSNVEGGWSGVGNVIINPGFAFLVDPHLLCSSPCVDAGTNSPSGGLPPDDVEGQPRVLDGDGNGSAVADMGAYEFNPATPTLAVSATALTIMARLGQTGSEVFEIRNASLGALAWDVECEANWLTADPAAGESAGEVDTITLTADTVGLAHGTYVTTVWNNADQAFNAPRAVTVVLQVSTTLHVPGEYPTIQAAIDAATTPGDEVVIADGVYTGAGNKDLDFHGRAITVRSASGDPGACIIDCEGSGRGFYFHSGEGAASIVQDLTIRNGNASGVYCYESSGPTLTNCTITGNATTYSGGGVFCYTSSSPTLTNCTITGNTSGTSGSGVYCADSSSPTLTNCTITGNTSGTNGSGVYCADSSSPTLTNCTIVGNTAAGAGGGLSCSMYSDPTLTNCTIVGNTSMDSGGGVYCSWSDLTLTNCILWANTPPTIYVYNGDPIVSYCDVQGGWPGTGNIDADPLFTDSPTPGPDDQWGTPDDDFGDLHLLHGSVCIDAGNNAAVPPNITGDMEGSPRFVDVECRPDTGAGLWPVVDMGAYEAPDAPLIDCNGNGLDDLCDVLAGTSLDVNGNGVPDECELCHGDLDCTGAVDFVDINAFVLYLSNFPVWQTTYAGCDAAHGDIDGNGEYPSFGDINPFVTLLSTHSLPMPCSNR